jgi:ABC-type branched-subunit amino acid transport system substrate-binding protein
MNRMRVALCAAAATTLALSGCAQNSEGDGGSGGGSDGGPIRLMVIESMTGMMGIDQTAPAGAEAAAAAINDAGGVGDREIEIIACDTASDPNKSTECARDAIEQDVVAVVGSFDPAGVAASLPVLDAAGIPYLASLALFPSEFSSANSFPVTAGAPGGTFGMVTAADDAGCKVVGTLGDTAIDQGQTEALAAGLTAAGMEGYYVELPASTPDVTPVVAELLDRDPDCIAYAASGQVGVQIFSAVRRAGSDAQFISATGSMLVPFLQALGEDAEGLIATSEVQNLDTPDLQPFRDDMEKYQPDVEPVNFTLYGWYGVQAFAQAAEGLDEITAATLLEQLGTIDDLELPGLPPVDFTQTRDSELFPRMFNTQIRYFAVENSTYVPSDDEWHDASTVLP